MQRCAGRNGGAGSLQKDGGLGAGPCAHETTHQAGAQSLHTQFHSSLSTSFDTSAAALKHPCAQLPGTPYTELTGAAKA